MKRTHDLLLQSQARYCFTQWQEPVYLLNKRSLSLMDKGLVYANLQFIKTPSFIQHELWFKKIGRIKRAMELVFHPCLTLAMKKRINVSISEKEQRANGSLAERPESLFVVPWQNNSINEDAVCFLWILSNERRFFKKLFETFAVCLFYILTYLNAGRWRIILRKISVLFTNCFRHIRSQLVHSWICTEIVELGVHKKRGVVNPGCQRNNVYNPLAVVGNRKVVAF